ncbi:MAG TPA: hypothetical protein VKA65_02515 [Acidimicrobiales bacterium]|nr:hypothetical protein [Acidimicrobiales bacterium]
MRFRRVETNPLTPRTLFRSTLGAVLIGVGAAGMIRASVGVTPWDVLTTAVSDLADITVGQSGALLTVIVLAACVPFGRLPGWGNLTTMFGVGVAVDLTLAALEEPGTLLARVALYAVSVPVVCLGVALVVRADIGVGPLEMVMLVATDRRTPLVVARVVIEATTLVLGWVLGGALGVGTAVFALTAGPLIAMGLRLQPAGQPSREAIPG